MGWFSANKLFKVQNLRSDTVKYITATLILTIAPFALDLIGIWELISVDLNSKIRATLSLVAGFCSLKAYQHRVNTKTDL